MHTRRPFGVALIAIVQALNALTLGLEVATARRTVPGPVEDTAFLAIIGGLVVVTGLATAVGLWRLRRWAWVATMLWVGLVMALALLAYLDGSPSYPVMTLSVLQVLYLNQSEVQRAFRARQAESEVPVQ